MHTNPSNTESMACDSHDCGPRTSEASGVCFQELSCHGYMAADEYQSTFVSWLVSVPARLRGLLSGSRQAKRVEILGPMNGSVRPGEMLLVLGRPGSGCSTFLKALAGDTYGVHLESHGISYGGVSYQKMQSREKGDRMYVAELDVHFPELTVRETLAFATKFRDVRSTLNIEASLRHNEDSSQILASLFHLDKSFHTPVGSATIRGISGGEKRRLSLAEALISGARYQCWDNSTRGLDSATATSFISLLRNTTEKNKSVVIMTVYQASEAQYQIFDKVMLLYEGRQIYFGPAAAATAYFEDLGFVRPIQSTTADFLTSLTNPGERMTRQSNAKGAPSTPDEFATAWRQNYLNRPDFQDVSDLSAARPIEVERQESTRTTGFTPMISTRRQFDACIRRGMQRLRHNHVPIVAGIAANFILALILGSAFYDLPPTAETMDRRAVLLFFSLIVNAFSPAFEVSTMWAQRPIVEKHSRYGYYEPFVEGLTSMICDVPNKVVTSILFNVTLYFMTNLRRTVSAFFTYYLFNFTVILTMSMYFRMIGSVSRRLEQTMTPSSIAILLCSIYSGFVVPVAYMIPWLGWLRFVNPLAYVYENLMIIEFNERSFPCSSLVPNGPTYTLSQGTDGKVCPVIGALPGEQLVHGQTYLSQKYNYIPDHLWRNFAVEIALMVALFAVQVLATQFILAERSKGDVLLFRRSAQTIHDSADRMRESGPEHVTNKSPFFAQDVVKSQGHEVSMHSPMTLPLQRQSAVFAWRNLCYDISAKSGSRRILSDVTGWVEPGTLTALMGVTGAGKTTLLDVLANRAAFGIESGQILVGGEPRDSSFQRRIGYVQQEDLHPPTATVRETLRLNALLRQSGTENEQEKVDYVETVMNLLDMRPYADAVIGLPGAGLNIEQRKRLSIGVELVAKPGLLLFLDEPTSGLDSQTAWSICELLRKLAAHGQAILCTIHQPSAQIFQMFDRLLLLSRTGQTLYFGDIGTDACTVIQYFQNQGARPYSAGALANPAEWVLNITSGEDSDAWSAKFKLSTNASNAINHMPSRGAAKGLAEDKLLEGGTRDEFAAPILRQLQLVTKQVCQDFWRDPTYLHSKMALCIGLALFNGLSFTNSPQNQDLQSLINIIYSIFLLSMIYSTMNQQIIPRLIENRSFFEARDARSKSYSWTVFLGAQILVEIFWQTVASLLVFVSWYFPTGLWRNGTSDFSSTERGALSFVLILFFCLWISTVSQAIAACTTQAETAVQLATLTGWLSLVFSGVLVRPADLPGFWIFLYRMSPLTYFVKGLAVAGFANRTIDCSATELLHIEIPRNRSIGINATCSGYLNTFVQSAGGQLENPAAVAECRYCPVLEANAVLQSLGMNPEERWQNAGYLSIYIFMNIVAIFLLYWLIRRPGKKIKL